VCACSRVDPALSCAPAGALHCLVRLGSRPQCVWSTGQPAVSGGGRPSGGVGGGGLRVPAHLLRQGTVKRSVCVATAAPLATATVATSFCLQTSAAAGSCAGPPRERA